MLKMDKAHHVMHDASKSMLGNVQTWNVGTCTAAEMRG